jgi:hypothetical protein
MGIDKGSDVMDGQTIDVEKLRGELTYIKAEVIKLAEYALASRLIECIHQLPPPPPEPQPAPGPYCVRRQGLSNFWAVYDASGAFLSGSHAEGTAGMLASSWSQAKEAKAARGLLERMQTWIKTNHSIFSSAWEREIDGHLAEHPA